MQLHFRASEIVPVSKFSVAAFIKGFPGGSVVKNPPAMQEMQVRSMGREDPLEEGMVTHFSILAWRIPWTEEPGGLQSIACSIPNHTKTFAKILHSLCRSSHFTEEETYSSQGHMVGTPVSFYFVTYHPPNQWLRIIIC